MLITALVAVLLAASPSAAEPERYRSAEFGFGILPPSGATIEELSPITGEEFLLRIQLGGSPALETLVRTALASDEESPLEWRRKALDRVKGQPHVGSVSTGSSPRGDGSRVPWLRAEFLGEERAERIEAFFFQANGLRYILQFRAEDQRFDALRSTVDAILASFETFPIPLELLRDRKLRALTQQCASDLDWAQTWEEAALRSRKERRLILVVARFYPGFDFSDALTTGPLFDADVQKLIARRFVPMRLGPERAVPFRNAELYGLSGTTLGHGLLVATSDGRVIHESSVVATPLVDDYLRRVLGSAAHHDAPPEDETALERARWHYERGQLDRCLETLGDARDRGSRFLRAQSFRRLRDPRALSEIESVVAGQRGDRPELIERVLIDRARILQGLGRVDEAMAALEPLAFPATSGEVASPEARVRLAELYEVGGDRDAADALLVRVIEESPEHRWARRAAAALTRSSREVDLRLDPAWPSPELTDASALPPRTGITPNASAALAAGQYLIERQRNDGRWPSPHLVGIDATQPDPLSEAVAALAGHALLPYRSDPAAARSIDQVLARLVDRFLEPSTSQDETVHYMDYWVWTRIYQLRFVAACLAADTGNREQLESVARRLVDAVIERQRPSGGWSYYATRDLGSDAVDTGSFSFVTAAAVLSLRAAEEAGFEVPASAYDRAGRALDRARSELGGWSYGCDVNAHAAPTSPRASAGRGPLIQLARHSLGRASVDDLRTALTTFVEFIDDLHAEQGKVLMHAGPEGQGSHYILFDCAFAAATIERLPEAERAQFAEPLLRLVTRCHTADGGYHDMPGMGRAAGTALALECYGYLGLAVPEAATPEAAAPGKSGDDRR